MQTFACRLFNNYYFTAAGSFYYFNGNFVPAPQEELGSPLLQQLQRSTSGYFLIYSH
jgi:hypothetical protein